jgi:hypothetical protein
MGKKSRRKKEEIVFGLRAQALPSPCPHCGRVLNGCTAVSNSKEDADKHPGAPAVGNLSVCGFCGGLNKYDRHLNFVELTREDLRKLSPKERRFILGMSARYARSVPVDPLDLLIFRIKR